MDSSLSLITQIIMILAAIITVIKATGFDKTILNRLRRPIKRVAKKLLDNSYLTQFNFDGNTASTSDDEASLNFIIQIIGTLSQKYIWVFGRGPSAGERMTSRYLTAVAKAIQRGVEYRRILIIDPALPQNAIVWILFLERFINPIVSKSVIVRTRESKETDGLIHGYQIVDGKYLHLVDRSYSKQAQKAARHSPSIFYSFPDPSIKKYEDLFHTCEDKHGAALDHQMLIEVLKKLINAFKNDQRIFEFYWGYISKALTTIENLDISEIPSRGVAFIGCLMPFDYSHQAAEEFCNRLKSNSKMVITVPFEHYNEIMAQFIIGQLDYLCSPIENEGLAGLEQSISVPDRAFLTEKCQILSQVQIRTNLVLSGLIADTKVSKKIYAVHSIYQMISPLIPKSMRRIWAKNINFVTSNYEAALKASLDKEAIAVTELSIALHLNLPVLKELNNDHDPFFIKYSIYKRIDS